MSKKDNVYNIEWDFRMDDEVIAHVTEVMNNHNHLDWVLRIKKDNLYIIDILRFGFFNSIKFYTIDEFSDDKLQEVILNSPASRRFLEKISPQHFQSPEPGEYIAVKLFDFSPTSHQIRKFSHFEGNKVFVFNKNNKLRAYDVYQIIDNNIFVNYWLNSYGTHVTFPVLERRYNDIHRYQKNNKI